MERLIVREMALLLQLILVLFAEAMMLILFGKTNSHNDAGQKSPRTHLAIVPKSLDTRDSCWRMRTRVCPKM